MNASRQISPGGVETPILPRGDTTEQPLLVILATMAFLAGVTLMVTLMGFRTSASWKADLTQTATVQIYANAEDDRGELIAESRAIIAQVWRGSEISPLTDDESRELLQPWLGDLDLPDDLPVPILLRVKLSGESAVDIALLKVRLTEAGIDADIDDHTRWRDSMSRTWRALQLCMGIIMIMVLIASMAIASFAAQSVLRSRHVIIDVLSQVGATDRYISRLFWVRFLVYGLRGALAGAVGALLFLFLFSTLRGSLSAGFLPALNLQISDIFWLVIMVIIMGIITALTAARTVRTQLRKARRLS